MKKALVTGITGQDGIYLSELLLARGYEVHGLVRYGARVLPSQLLGLSEGKLVVHYGDLTDSGRIQSLIYELAPDEIYNLGAQSHVGESFKSPVNAMLCNGLGVVNILEAVKAAKLHDRSRIYQASTSELYGQVLSVPQHEGTGFYPRSPYATAKLYAYWACINYRESYNMHVSNGILFNHESPLRGEMFVTRKITKSLAAIETGVLDSFCLGNLDAKRDWGHARDYVEAQWLMLQQDSPDDYVIATGIQHSVRQFVEKAASSIGIHLEWVGEGVSEKGIDQDGRVIVSVDERLFRPNEVNTLLGDATKARKVLQWEPKVTFDDLVNEMQQFDLNLARSQALH